ncbi:MAG: Gfo/Idh/MocA family oxidoreductase [Planctomycetes bacterium]|nr:Gfo/Idh/MocA family oxidoreductase [Planctomycetota bacterium]
MARKSYRVAVIGSTGRGDYGHGLDVVWREIEGVEVVAVADDDPRGREEAAKRLGARAAYADYRELLAKERPQIASVGPRWIDRHAKMVLACAEHGASVFLEKPFVRTLAEADAVVRACDMAHVKLAIAHQTRYSPRLRVVREILGEGRLGEVLEIRGRGKEDRRGGGEDLWVLGTHVFDLMRFLAGDARWCFARVTQEGRPIARADVRQGNEGIGPLAGDGVHALYGFGGEVVGHFSSLRGRGGSPSRYGIRVFGTKGALEVGFGFLPRVRILLDASWSPSSSGSAASSDSSGSAWEEVTSAGIGKPEPLKDLGLHGGNVAIARDLIAAIEEDRQPLGGAREALGATEMIAAVFESQRQGRPVPLPLESRENPLVRL